MKFCPKCKQSRPLSEFNRNSAHPSGRQGYCRICTKAYDKRRYMHKVYKTPTERQCTLCNEILPLANFRPKSGRCRDCGVAVRHSLTKAQYLALIDRQSGLCAICSLPGSLCVDHDHACCPGASSCGQCIRGMLCRKCNTGLGLFNESQSLIRNALTYIIATS